MWFFNVSSARSWYKLCQIKMKRCCEKNFFFPTFDEFSNEDKMEKVSIFEIVLWNDVENSDI